MAGRILIVNGTSGSGKTTTCERFVATADECWLYYGVDHFLGQTFPRAYGHRGPRAAEGYEAVPENPADPNGPLRWRLGPLGERAFALFHEWLATAARMGFNLVADHLLLADPPILQDCVRRLAGLPVWIVTLKPPFAVLEARIAERDIANRFGPGHLSAEEAARARDRLERLRPWFYRAVYENPISDLVVDTAREDPDAVCARIRARLAAGPGTALAELARRYGAAV